MRESYLRACDALIAVERKIIIGLMAVMTVDVLIGIISRYVAESALVWTEEAARYMMIWMGFVGMSVALREGGHVAVDMLVEHTRGGLRRILVLTIQTLVLVFLVAVIGAFFALLPVIHYQTTPVLAIRMMWPYLAIPVGCLLTALEVVALMLRGPAGAAALSPAKSA